jgi:PAS domain S-box-containing protein
MASLGLAVREASFQRLIGSDTELRDEQTRGRAACGPRPLRLSKIAMQPQQTKPSFTSPSLAEVSFRSLVENIKDYAIFMVDRGGYVQSWNAGAELIKGYLPSEIIGQHIGVFYTPEDRERGYVDELLAIAERQGRVEDEGWRVRKDGSRFWADVIITALRDPLGALSGFAKVTRDLSDRRKSELERRQRDEELLRSEERFRLIIDAVEDYAIFMLDPQGRVATWNSGAERLKGYTVKEIIGQHFERFRLDEDVREGRAQQELEQATREGRVESEGWRRRKDGSRFWAYVVLTAIRNSSGELLGFAKVTRDLTDRHRLDDERLHRARAEEAVRMRDEFLCIASHELKTPLTTVQIELQGLLELATGDERLAKRLGRAARNADRLAALIESLMDVSRIAEGGLRLKPEPLDLSETISHLADWLRPSAAKAGCPLAFSTSGPIHGSWDRLRLEQVVLNLCANAFKYGAGKPVWLSVSRDDDQAVIEVSDAGSGIPERDLQRIFGRFERAASQRHYGGLGLGLYVSREIVEAHHGTISARNLPEGGARFTVRLPIEANQGLAATPG